MAYHSSRSQLSFSRRNLVKGGGGASELFIYKCELTVSESHTGGALENFPVLVRLSNAAPAGFYSHAGTNGSEIRFADENGNLIPHEIDTWNDSGTSLVWVKLPQLAAGKKFTMYYGKAGAGDLPSVDSHDVWKQNYGMVWHMNETVNGKVLNAAQNKYHGKILNTGCTFCDAATDKGFCGKAINTPKYNETYGNIEIEHDNGLTPITNKFTLSCWFKLNDVPGNYPVLVKKYPSQNQNYPGFWICRENDNKKLGITTRNVSGGQVGLSTEATAGLDDMTASWNYVTFVVDGNSASIYVNGKIDAAATSDQMLPVAAESHNMYIAAKNFDGRVDEMRVTLDATRSPEWIATEYKTMTDPDFVSVGEGGFVDESNVLTIQTNEMTINGTSATLTGEIIKLGTATSVKAYILWGTDESLENATTVELGTFGAQTSLTETLENLHPNTKYYYAFKAVNAADESDFKLTDVKHFVIDQVSIAIEKTADLTWSVTVSRANTADVTEDAISINWTLNDASLVGTLVTADIPSPVVLSAGEVSKTFTVTGFAGAVADATLTLALESGGYAIDSSASSASLTIPARPVLYVANGGDDGNIGASADAPKATIQAAVSAFGANGGTIHVAAGEYSTDAPIEITSAIHVAGADKTTTTVKKGFAYNNRCCIFVLSHPSAKVSGFTLQGGVWRDAVLGAHQVNINRGTLADCIVTGTQIYHPFGRAAVYAGSSEAFVTHCIFTKNTTSPDGTDGCEKTWAAPAPIALYLENGAVAENCLFYNNYYTAPNDPVNSIQENGASAIVRVEKGASLRNSTFVGNSAYYCICGIKANDDGTSSSSVVNCAFFNNRHVGTLEGAANDSWGGVAAGYINCASDAEAKVNDTCKSGLSAAAFKNYKAIDLDNPAEAPAYTEFDLTPARISPLRNAGYGTELVAEGATDLAGNPRVQGRGIDIGAYEAAPVCGFSVFVR